MSEPTTVADWRDRVEYGDQGPVPTIIYEDEKLRVIIGGLEPGQQIPEHPEELAMYHFLGGEGWMIVDGQRHRVSAGATIVVPAGSARGMEAASKLAFLATRVA